jgi:hypothetical protein
MSKYIWEGNKTRLRSVEVSDWEIFGANDLDSETARLCDQSHLRRTVYTNGTYYDELFYGLIKEEFEDLTRKYFYKHHNWLSSLNMI